MQGTAKDRLIRATSRHAAGRVAAGLLGVATAAYGFHALGPARYGLLTLVAAFSLLLVLVEFGLRTSTVTFVAEDAGRGDAASARALLGTACLVHLAAGGAMAAGFSALAGPLADGAGVEPGLRGEAVLLLRVSAVSLVLGNAASCWTSVLVALQRTGPVAAGMCAGGAVQLAATWGGVEAGWGAGALGAGFAASVVVRAAVEAPAAARAFPGASVLPWHATRAAMARLSALGRHVQVGRIADVFVFQWDRVLAGRFLGLEAGGVYLLAADLVAKVREVPLLLAGGVLPAATEVRDADGGRAIRNLYLRGTKYVAAAALFAAAFGAAAAPGVMAVLGGAEGAAGAAVLAILLAGTTANVAVGVGTQVGIVLGQAGLQARAAVITSATALLCVPAALAAGLGLPGAAAGTALALVAGPAWYLRPLHRALGVPTGEALRTSYLPPLLPALGVAGAVLALHRWTPVGGLLPGAGRGTLLAVLAAEAAVLGAAFLGTLWASGWVDAFDRDVLRRLRAREGGGEAR
jgi:O-antigen/teichoic acid export membrane protein